MEDDVTRYLIRRILQAIPLLVGVSIISFVIIHAAPGGPMMAYEDPRQTAADRLRLEQALGLDQPLPVQYLKWMNGVAQGDLGNSYFPVSEYHLSAFHFSPSGSGSTPLIRLLTPDMLC